MSVTTKSAMKEQKVIIRNGAVQDGSIDVDREGNLMQRLAADPPGVLFKCDCGHVRRVTPEERRFACENPAGTCGLIWHRQGTLTGEINPITQHPLWEDVKDENGLITFTCEKISDVIARQRAEKLAAGIPLNAQPQGPSSQQRAESAGHHVSESNPGKYFVKAPEGTKPI